MESLQEIRDRLTRIEDKLDAHLHRAGGQDKDIAWIKGSIKYIWIVLLGAVGKLAHITFFSP